MTCKPKVQLKIKANPYNVLCEIASMSPEYWQVIMITDPSLLEVIKQNWLMRTNHCHKFNFVINMFNIFNKYNDEQMQ